MVGEGKQPHHINTPSFSSYGRFFFFFELLALAAPVGQRLKPELISTLKTLGIGRRLPRRRSCHGGARKVRAISVAGPSSVRSRDLSPTTVPASFCHRLPCTPSSPGCNPHNLVKIDTSPLTQELSRRFKVMLLNAQSVRNKTTDICDHVDLVFLCETYAASTRRRRE